MSGLSAFALSFLRLFCELVCVQRAVQAGNPDTDFPAPHEDKMGKKQESSKARAWCSLFNQQHSMKGVRCNAAMFLLPYLALDGEGSSTPRYVRAWKC